MAEFGYNLLGVTRQNVAAGVEGNGFVPQDKTTHALHQHGARFIAVCIHFLTGPMQSWAYVLF